MSGGYIDDSSPFNSASTGINGRDETVSREDEDALTSRVNSLSIQTFGAEVHSSTNEEINIRQSGYLDAVSDDISNVEDATDNLIKTVATPVLFQYEAALSIPVYLSLVIEEVEDSFYMAHLNCSPEEAKEYNEFARAQGLSPSTMLEIIKFKQAFGSQSLDAAKMAFLSLTRKSLDPMAISAFIQDKIAGWKEEVAATNKPVYIRARDFPEHLSRNLQINPDGTVYILYNRVKAGDKLVGQGEYKKAKEALNIITGELAVRITMEKKDEKTTKIANDELALNIELSGQPGIAHTYRVTALDYMSRGANPGEVRQKLGYMQKYYNGGNLDKALKGRLSDKERSLITDRILKGVSWLHQTKGIIHRDLKPGNIFLTRDRVTNEVTDAVVADMGLACSQLDNEKKSQAIGTAAFMSPAVCKASFSSGVVEEKKEAVKKVMTFAHDDWAAGLILLELHRSSVPEWRFRMLEELTPWQYAKTTLLVAKAVAQLQEGWLPEPADKNSIGHIIWEMLKVDPAAALSSPDALARVEAVNRGAEGQ
jgi:hypothetical protein